MLTIRPAAESDRVLWRTLDHVPEAVFLRKIREGEALTAEEDGRPVAILRWNFFWDEIPFCNLLYLAEDRRGRGYGSLLMARWERELAARGCDMAMVSTQSDETAQHFYRKLGYRDCGGFIVDIPGHEQPLELIFLKGLGREEGPEHGI